MNLREVVGVAVGVAVLVVACGGDEDCPEGLTRVGDRCVAPDAGAGDGDADADADGDCGDGGPLALYFDGDGDGFGVDGTEEYGCEAGAGQATQGGDCDDAEAFVRPDAAERCNAADDDCDGAPDDGLGCVAGAVTACETACGSTGEQTCSDACIPSHCTIPEETCNHVDDDCDGLVDEGLQGWIDEPVQLTDDELWQHNPVIGWTGTELAVGWTEEDPASGRWSVQVATFGLDGAPVGAPIEVAVTDTLPMTAGLGVIGELALYGYAVEPVAGRGEPVVALTPLGGGGGPVPVPLSSFGDIYFSMRFDVFPTPDDGMLVSMVTLPTAPNELRVATWSLDPIRETHTLSLADVPFAEAELTPAGDLLVCWAADGEMLVGRYDSALGEVEAPRVVTATGGQVLFGQIVAVGESALVLYGTTDDNVHHALPLGEDLAPGAAVDYPGFPDVLRGAGVSSSSGTEVLAMAGDPDTKTGHVVRLGPDGTAYDGPTELPPGMDFIQLRTTWAGDRWALVWIDHEFVEEFEVFLHTYGCL